MISFASFSSPPLNNIPSDRTHGKIMPTSLVSCLSTSLAERPGLILDPPQTLQTHTRNEPRRAYPETSLTISRTKAVFFESRPLEREIRALRVRRSTFYTDCVSSALESLQEVPVPQSQISVIPEIKSEPRFRTLPTPHHSKIKRQEERMVGRHTCPRFNPTARPLFS